MTLRARRSTAAARSSSRPATPRSSSTSSRPRRYPTLLDRLIDALKQVEGAYSLVCLTAEGLIACRDPLGIRPLVMGKLGEATIFASETVALDVIGADLHPRRRAGRAGHRQRAAASARFRPVRAGAAAPLHLRACLFLAARHASSTARRSTKCARTIGAELAREAPVEADLCRAGARQRRAGGDRLSARQSGIPFELGIIRSHYVGRTFIQPSQEVRHLGVKLKHNANSRADRGQAHRADRRFDRPRHDHAEDRADDARCRRARSAHAHRLAADQAQLLLRRRHARAREAARRADERRGDGATTSTPTASPSSRSTASTARSASDARRRRSRSAATPASPATIRPRLTDLTDKRRQAGSLSLRRQPLRAPAMTDAKPFDGQARARHRRQPRHRRRHRRSARRGRRACRPHRPHRAPLEEVEERIHAAGGSATIAPMDLTETRQRSPSWPTAVAERWDALDILVLNAAMLGSLTPVAHIDAKEFDRVLTLNVLANQALIAAFDPLLRKSEAGRRDRASPPAVGRKPRAFWGAYGASKAALETLVGAYADETAQPRAGPGRDRRSRRHPHARCAQRAFPGEDPASAQAARSGRRGDGRSLAISRRARLRSRRLHAGQSACTLTARGCTECSETRQRPSPTSPARRRSRRPRKPPSQYIR